MRGIYKSGRRPERRGNGCSGWSLALGNSRSGQPLETVGKFGSTTDQRIASVPCQAAEWQSRTKRWGCGASALWRIECIAVAEFSITAFRLTGARVERPILSRTVKAFLAGCRKLWTPHGIDPKIRVDPHLPTVSRGPPERLLIECPSGF